MVKLLKNLWLKWQFKKAYRQCQKLNAQAGKEQYIVINLVGKPYITDRKSFRNLRKKGVFKTHLKWSDIYQKRVTTNQYKL